MSSAAEELRDVLTYAKYAFLVGNQVSNKDFYDRATPDSPPVLLVHGFLGTRGAMIPMELRLKRDGFAVFSIDLGVLNIKDIKQSALKIERKINRILREVDLWKIDIVGHSMGGLIGLHYVKQLAGHKRVRKLVTIGTPHEGTWTAVAGVALIGLLSPSSWQLLPGSDFLKDLQTGALPPSVEYHSIAGRRDRICPAARARLHGGLHHEVDVGHAGLINSKRVYRIVRDILLAQRPDSEE